MRERVQLLGGTFAAGPHGGGWQVRAGFPLQQREEAP
jgi:signal transduction histidine kinase